MSLIAFVTDQMAIGKILDHLDAGSPETAKPPPPTREVLRVADHADGWGTPQQWDPAQQRLAALGDAQAEVDRLWARWAELEAKAEG